MNDSPVLPLFSALGAGSTNGILEVRSPVAGVILRVEVVVDAGNGAGAAIFDVNRNGTTIFTDQDTRPEIAAGDISANVGGLAEPVARLDLLSIDADNIPAGGFPAKSLTLIVTIDDGAAEMLSPDEVAKSLYAGAFDRAPDSTELASARAAFRTASLINTAAFVQAVRDAGHTLFISAEYIARGRSDTEFVGDLYRAYLGREPDDDGLADWLAVLTSGATRAATDTAFSGATEFTEIRATRLYGGASGARSANPMTTAGDIIVGGVGGTETRVAKPAANNVWGTDASGMLGYKADPAGGSAAVAPFDSTHPDAVPAVPNALDDEFETGALNAKWVWANPDAQVTSGVGNGAFWIRSTASGANAHVARVQPFTPGSAYKIRMKVSVPWPRSNCSGGIIIRNSTTGRIHGVYFTGGETRLS